MLVSAQLSGLCRPSASNLNCLNPVAPLSQACSRFNQVLPSILPDSPLSVNTLGSQHTDMFLLILQLQSSGPYKSDADNLISQGQRLDPFSIRLQDSKGKCHQ